MKDVIKVVRGREDCGLCEEETSEVRMVTRSIVALSSSGQRADEWDLEDGEIRDEAGDCDAGNGENRVPVSGAPGDPTDLAVRGQGHPRDLCSSWLLGSCEDVRCAHAHGYVPRMCPRSFCPPNAACPYAHSEEVLRRMQASEAVVRQIDRVRVDPTLCADNLGSGGCSRGDACPFAHCTEELLRALARSAYRKIQREVRLQIETRDENDMKNRSRLCCQWLRGRSASL